MSEDTRLALSPIVQIIEAFYSVCVRSECENCAWGFPRLDPSKRPTAEQLLQHPIVAKHMDCVPIASDSELPYSRRGQLVGTIHVPRMLGELQSRLPGSKYENDSMCEDVGCSERGRGSGGSSERRNRRALVAQSMDESVLSRSKSDGECYHRKKGGRIEQNVRKSQQHEAIREQAGFLPQLPGAVKASRDPGIMPISRYSERPTPPLGGVCHNHKLPVSAARDPRAENMAAFHHRRRPW